MSRGLVLIHGIFSSGRTWASLERLIMADSELSDLVVSTFSYYTPRLRLSPLKTIPDHDDVARKLWTYLEPLFETYTSLTLVSHSQGGLVVQRMLANQTQAGHAEDLNKIDKIVMLACPNSGSDLFLALRRYVLARRNPQEVALRPLDKMIEQTRATVLRQVVYASGVSESTCPIPIYAYAGEQDGVVKSQSAISQFRFTGVLDGDHSSILDFEAPHNMNYSILRKHLKAAKPKGVRNRINDDQQLRGISGHLMPRPDQLPRRDAPLVGREDDLQNILSSLTGSSVRNAARLAVISGIGGIGKTALAVEAADRVRRIYSDGILYVDMKGIDAEPLDPDDALKYFLIGLGVPPQVVANDDTDRIALYRSVLADRQILVVLDNVASDTQVRQLIPSSSPSAAIVTSRYRLEPLVADVRVELGYLEQSDASQMLAGYISAGSFLGSDDMAQITELARLCGGWPLAIHIIGALANRRSFRGVDDLALRLTSDRNMGHFKIGNVDLKIMVEDSMRELSEVAKRLFERLSLAFGADFSDWICQVLLDEVDNNAAMSALDELVEANLVESRTIDGTRRYVMHDLIRSLAEEWMELNEDSAKKRLRIQLLDAYRERAIVCRKALEPDRPPYGLDPINQAEADLLRPIGDPEKWLETERHALIRAVEFTSQNDLLDYAVDLANALPTYFIIRGTWNEWADTYDLAVAAAEHSGNQQGLGYILQGLANIRRTIGCGTGADLLERSLNCFTDIGDEIGEAYLLNDVGLVRMYEGRWREAESALLESERRLSAAGHRIMALQPRRNRAIVSLERGETASAAHDLQAVAAEMGKFGDVRWQAYSLADLGKAYRILGEEHRAVRTIRQSIELMVAIGDKRWAAATRIRLGDTLRTMGAWEEAGGEYDRAIDQFIDLEDPLWAARAALGKALAEACVQHFQEGLYLCNEARKVFARLSSRVDECISIATQARILQLYGRQKEGDLFVNEARQIATELGRSDDYVDRVMSDEGPDVR